MFCKGPRSVVTHIQSQSAVFITVGHRFFQFFPTKHKQRRIWQLLFRPLTSKRTLVVATSLDTPSSGQLGQTVHTNTQMRLSVRLQILADLVLGSEDEAENKHRSHNRALVDIGYGHGDLLAYLQRDPRWSGALYGVEKRKICRSIAMLRHSWTEE